MVSFSTGYSIDEIIMDLCFGRSRRVKVISNGVAKKCLGIRVSRVQVTLCCRTTEHFCEFWALVHVLLISLGYAIPVLEEDAPHNHQCYLELKNPKYVFGKNTALWLINLVYTNTCLPLPGNPGSTTSQLKRLAVSYCFTQSQEDHDGYSMHSEIWTRTSQKNFI